MMGVFALFRVSVLASLAGVTIAANCNGDHFWWAAKGVCLPKGGPRTSSHPPDLITCPDTWYWTGSYCAPKSLQYAATHTCSNNYVWDESRFWCTPPKCAINKFWYDPLAKCIVRGGPSNPRSPPVGSSCPLNWYWAADLDLCLPKYPNFQSPPVCSENDVWSPTDQCCHALPRPTCGRTEFYWPERNCCLPHGGPPSPPPPPPGHQCPRQWSWHSGKGCCVPHFPNPPSRPTCPGNWRWNPRPCTCEPGSEPSHSITRPKKRSIDLSLCPKGKTACLIPGLFGGEYECLDTTVELESCGGCVSQGVGHDCTAIPHASNVACDRGACQVYSCALGFDVSVDGKDCIPR